MPTLPTRTLRIRLQLPTPKRLRRWTADALELTIGPTEPEASPWSFPPGESLDPGNDLVALGADLEPGTVLKAYRSAYFPMPMDGSIGWFSPDPRGVLWPTDFHASRSLLKSAKRFSVTVDKAFDAVLDGCADPSRPHGWIDQHIKQAYGSLHKLGWAHSVEVWDGEELAGGMYGLAIGGLFAGESMFHRKTDASKVALLALTNMMRTRPGTLLDVQWLTPHLASLGAIELPRPDYLLQLQKALQEPTTGIMTQRPDAD